MNNLSSFQVVFTGIIMGLVVLALLVFAGIIPGFSSIRGTNPVSLTMWGFLPEENFTETIGLVNGYNEETFKLSYVEKSKETYKEGLLDALASGAGPDIFMLTPDMVLEYRQKAYLIPFDIFSERSFKDAFIDVADIFLWKVEDMDSGIVAVPFLIDPVVMYWNKDIFNSIGLARAPKFWDEFQSYSISLTEKNVSGNITRSGAAMGEYSNIRNAKDIFSMLVLQSGNKMIDPSNLDVVFGEKGDLVVEPVNSALSFFTSFSNPSKVSYSWNRALPDSRDFFSGGKLAVYFGYASEYKDIVKQNPHLNFDIAVVPQTRDSSIQATFGNVYAWATSKNSLYIGPAISAAFSFMGDDIMEGLNQGVFLPPVKRNLIDKGTKEPLLSVFYKSAVQARSWLEPDSESVSSIFKDMIESVVYGRKNISQAVSDAKRLLEAEMPSI
ncbi:extracellular solute-binding protein [Patescibacteria group bacterium]|nr:extracellular solute-binding protein [Patescibacteria group bacterium]